MDRRARAPPHEGLPHKKSGHEVPKQDAGRSNRKKSPRLGTVRDICQAWAETFPANTTQPQAVARELADLAGQLTPYELTELHVRMLCDRWKLRHGRARRYKETTYLIRLLRSIESLTGRSDLLQAVTRVRPGSPRTTIATPQEIAALVAHAEPWLRTIVLLATHAGLRRSDCLRVAPIHYNAETRILSIEQKKTGRTVSLPVTETLAAQLERIQPDEPTQPYAVAFRGGKRIHPKTLQDAWTKLKKRAEVNRDLWIHDLRRTTAVSLYQLTKDLTAVEAFLGHASLHSTIGYLEHKDPGKLKPYLDQMWKPKTGTVQ